MTPERWQRIEKSASITLERKPGERAPFLIKRLGRRGFALRSRISTRVNDQIGSFLKSPAFEDAAHCLGHKEQFKLGQRNRLL